MDNKKTDEYYLEKITTDLKFIIDHTKDLSQNDLEENEILVDSMMFRLIQISENSAKLSDSFKQNYSNIPWHAMKGLRNKIVHEYGNVDFYIVYETVQKDIPNLLNIIMNIK